MTSLFTPHLLSIAMLLAGPPAPAEAGTANNYVHFPAVHGANLEGREFHLPGDFEGRVNLVFVAFKREQQSAVDTWLAPAREWVNRHEGLRYYELPTIHAANRFMRWFIDNGMRRGIPDPAAREVTITLYLDKEPFREALQIPTEDAIYTFLLDERGRVVWRTEGEYTQKLAGDLEQKIAGLLEVVSGDEANETSNQTKQEDES